MLVVVGEGQENEEERLISEFASIIVHQPLLYPHRVGTVLTIYDPNHLSKQPPLSPSQQPSSHGAPRGEKNIRGVSLAREKIALAQKSSRSYQDIERDHHNEDDEDDDLDPPSFDPQDYDNDMTKGGKRGGKRGGMGGGKDANNNRSTNHPSFSQLPGYARVRESNELDRVKLARELRIQHQKDRAREIQSNKAMNYWR